MSRKTMGTINYGFSTPGDLYEKLRRDTSSLKNKEEPDTIFNFFVTASSMYDWAKNYFGQKLLEQVKFKLVSKGKSGDSLLRETLDWVDATELPPIREENSTIAHVIRILHIVRAVANGSKHFELRHIESIAPVREPADWLEYYNFPITDGMCIEMEGHIYSVDQISNVVLSFYFGLLEKLETARTLQD